MGTKEEQKIEIVKKLQAAEKAKAGCKSFLPIGIVLVVLAIACHLFLNYIIVYFGAAGITCLFVPFVAPIVYDKKIVGLNEELSRLNL